MKHAADLAQRLAPLARALAGWKSAAAFAFVALLLFVPSVGSSVWEPYELSALEFSRRIALGLFGAADFALPGADNSLPSRGELDRGELPFTSMALAMRLFGLSTWAARLALFAWGVLGLAATYWLVRRLADRRAAVFSVLALATMPLYFLHARVLFGDGVTMAALALAVSGLALAVYDRGGAGARLACFALGAAGLLSAFLSRGLLLGVAVPALGVGLGWLVLRLAGAVRADPLATLLGSSLVACGLAASAASSLVLAQALAEPERYFASLGFGLTLPSPRPTFDALIQQLGHGLYPWSALLPIALGRVLALPAGLDPAARERESGLRATVLLTGVFGFGAGGWLADAASLLPFGPVAVLAVVGALALRDLDRGAPASLAAGVIVVALLALLCLDFKHAPELALRVFAVDSARFPDSFRAAGAPWLLAAAFCAGAGALAALFEREGEHPAPFRRDEYLAWLRTLRDLWNGNLLFGACVVEAALLGFLAFDLLGERIPSLQRFAPGSELTRLAGRVAWAVLPLLMALPLVAMALRDALRWAGERRRRGGLGVLFPTRGALALSGFVAGGSGLALAYYPGLARQLSPQEAFDAFRAIARPGEPIGIVGGDGSAAFYALGRRTSAFSSSEQGYEWLTSPGSERRWLVFRSDALAGLNSRHRGRTTPPRNLPILSARSSEILLASNRLERGEHDENPLERCLPTRLPAIGRPMAANLGGQLDVLGWDVTDLDGHSVPSVSPGRRYDFVIYFRVVERLTGSWETFVHIDGFQRRFNGDHPTLGGLYPFSLWRVGDVVVDRHTFVLEPNFTSGKYRVYFGLYSGSRRMPVESGAHLDDRLDAGSLVVN